MTYLETIKPKSYNIKINGKIYSLKFTLEAFAYLEEKFNSVNEAIKLFNEKNFAAILTCFEAGLLHTKEKHNIQRIINKSNPEILIFTLVEAMTSALSGEYGFDKEWDWSLLYFIAKPVLHLSEEEFWQSTPTKILSMLKIIEEVKGIKPKDITNDDAAKSFMSW